jgi:hypothetical protein
LPVVKLEFAKIPQAVATLTIRKYFREGPMLWVGQGKSVRVDRYGKKAPETCFITRSHMENGKKMSFISRVAKNVSALK